MILTLNRQITKAVFIGAINTYDAYGYTIGDDGELCFSKLHNIGGMGSFGVSLLFRAARFGGELPEHEKPLQVISEAIKAAVKSV
jgi:hypothetical protein